MCASTVVERQAEGAYVCSPMYAQKAKFFHEVLGVEGEFKAHILVAYQILAVHFCHLV
jgi:hypothetical protein